MPEIDTITIICIVGCLVFGFLFGRAPNSVWYIDQEGDGVSARSVCGYLALICLTILIAKVVSWVRG